METQTPAVRLIKKYGNRKLYDMESKRYVSLENLAELVRQGENLRIEEKATGKDVTSEVLAKVLVGEQKKGQSSFPQTYLHEMIRRGENLLGATVGHLEESFESLLEASVRRLTPVREYRREIDQLRARLERLEAVMERLEARASSKARVGPQGAIRVVPAKAKNRKESKK